MIGYGWIPMVLLIFGFGLLMDVSTTSAINDRREATAESAIHAFVPVAVQGWETSISAQVQANGVDGPFTAPTPFPSTSLCPSADPSCGVYGTATYAITSGSGGNTETKYYTQRASGNLCGSATGYIAGTITITISNGDGNTLGTDTLTTSDTTICGGSSGQYIARTGLSDAQGSISLNASGAYRTAGTYNGCWGADPIGCDTQQAANGTSSASDMKVHAYLKCAGKYCTGPEYKNVDNFQNVTTQNGGVTNGLAP